MKTGNGLISSYCLRKEEKKIYRERKRTNGNKNQLLLCNCKHFMQLKATVLHVLWLRIHMDIIGINCTMRLGFFYQLQLESYVNAGCLSHNRF